MKSGFKAVVISVFSMAVLGGCIGRSIRSAKGYFGAPDISSDSQAVLVNSPLFTVKVPGITATRGIEESYPVNFTDGSKVTSRRIPPDAKNLRDLKVGERVYVNDYTAYHADQDYGSLKRRNTLILELVSETTEDIVVNGNTTPVRARAELYIPIPTVPQPSEEEVKVAVAPLLEHE